MATAFGKNKIPKDYDGKSSKPGHGGRAAKLKAEGVPGGVIGAIARMKHAASGQKNHYAKGGGK